MTFTGPSHARRREFVMPTTAPGCHARRHETRCHRTNLRVPEEFQRRFYKRSGRSRSWRILCCRKWTSCLNYEWYFWLYVRLMQTYTKFLKYLSPQCVYLSRLCETENLKLENFSWKTNCLWQSTYKIKSRKGLPSLRIIVFFREL